MWQVIEFRKRIPYLILMFGTFSFKCLRFSIIQPNFLPVGQIMQLNSAVNIYLIVILQRIFIGF